MPRGGPAGHLITAAGGGRGGEGRRRGASGTGDDEGTLSVAANHRKGRGGTF